MLVMFMGQRYILQNNLTSSEVFYVAVYDNAIFLASFHKLYHVGIHYTQTLSTSLLRSTASLTCRVSLQPFSLIPDPDLTSLSLNPHVSQTIAMMITSLNLQ